LKNLSLLAALAVATLLAACGGGPDGTSGYDASGKLAPHIKSATDAYSTVTQQLYVAYFGRPADPTGLANFEAALLAAGAPTDIQSLNAAYVNNQTLRALIDSFGG